MSTVTKVLSSPRKAWWAVAAGATVAAVAWGWRKMFPERRTPRELRADEKARQREIRRGLRGLTTTTK
jgi:hypothetical protein